MENTPDIFPLSVRRSMTAIQRSGPKSTDTGLAELAKLPQLLFPIDSSCTQFPSW
jgi:hypothetical protein